MIQKCNCMNDFPRIRQDDENIPKNVKSGDWILSRVARGAEWGQYVLRPAEVTDEVKFKLVQKLNWFVKESDDYDGEDDEDEGSDLDEDDDVEEDKVEEDEVEEDEVEEDVSRDTVDMENQISAGRLSESVAISDFVRIRTVYILV
jgi:hypothetical protein